MAVESIVLSALMSIACGLIANALYDLIKYIVSNRRNSGRTDKS